MEFYYISSSVNKICENKWFYVQVFWSSRKTGNFQTFDSENKGQGHLKVIFIIDVQTLAKIREAKILGDTTFQLPSWPLKWGPEQNLNMVIESTYSTLYLMAIVMSVPTVTILKILTVPMWLTFTSTVRVGLLSALYATVCEIFTVETCITLTMTFGFNKVKCKYANGNALCDFLFVGNSNACSIGHRLRDVIGWNVRDLDPDI